MHTTAQGFRVAANLFEKSFRSFRICTPYIPYRHHYILKKPYGYLRTYKYYYYIHDHRISDSLLSNVYYYPLQVPKELLKYSVFINYAAY